MIRFAGHVYAWAGLSAIQADPALQVLRPAAAVAALLGCAPFINRNPYRRDPLLDQLQALNARLPVRALTFARDDRFWGLLRSGET